MEKRERAGYSMRKRAEDLRISKYAVCSQTGIGDIQDHQCVSRGGEIRINLQMRRAGVSIAANIAEGFKKRSMKDKRTSTNIAQGSLEELRYYLILSRDLGYLKEDRIP